jgi:ParB family chromosome partitioning protein
MSIAKVAERTQDGHVAVLNKLAAMAAPLAAASTVEEAKSVADTAKAIELWARRRKANRTVLVQAMEYQRRAERKIGEMLPPTAPGGRGKKLFHDETVCGMTRLVAHRCRKIAETNEAAFECWLAECRESEDEPTQAIAVRLHLGAHLRNNSGNSEWYTPQIYADAARQVMGGIDIDPCSCEDANRVIKATTFYSEADDGFSKEWRGRLYTNPPYGEGTIDKFADKLLGEVGSQRVTQAVVLVNNCTETKWFQRLLRAAANVCFPMGRISFWSVDRPSKNPLQGQAFLHFCVRSQDGTKFRRVFSKFGVCISKG